jgi:hypothetical protein
MHRRSATSAGLGVALWLSQAPALAQMTPEQCVDSNARAQHLRSDGKLSEARQELRKCADPSCPALVRNDCTRRLDDVENALPTIAFEVKDPSGADLTAVKVTVDDGPLVDTLDGTALPVDPGLHVFTFKAADRARVTRTLVLTEGEKGRRELVVLGESAASPPAPLGAATADTGLVPIEAASADQGAGGMGTQKVVGLVVAGVGAAGIAVGGVFGALAFSEKDQQVKDCATRTTCTPEGHRRAQDDQSNGFTDSTISNVAISAGGALLIGGVVLFLTGSSSHRLAPLSGLLLAPSVGRSGGGMLLRGEF